MANQTITANTNFDSLTGLLAGETVTINNGATLTINSDPQRNRVLAGSIVVNDGVLLIDGTKIRELNFSGASALPEIGDILTAGSVTGHVIGVTGIAAAGKVRLRSLNGAIGSGTALSFTGGKTATAASADGVGWLQVLANETSVCNILAGSRWSGNGEWYQLGIGSGLASQTVQHYCDSVIPCIWVETGTGTGIYKKYLNAGSRFPADVGSGERGYYFGMSNGSPTILFGDGINGNIPPIGARIRVPNITIGSALASAPTVPTLNTTLASWAWETSAGSLVVFDKVSISSVFLNGATTELSSTGVLISLSNSNQSIVASDVGVGMAGNINHVLGAAINISNASLYLNDCAICRNATAPAVSVFVSSKVEIHDSVVTSFAGGSAIGVTNASQIMLEDVTVIGGNANFSAASNVSIKRFGISDRVGTLGSVSSAGSAALRFTGGCNNILIDGWTTLTSFGLLQRPLIEYSNGGSGLRIRNIIYDCLGIIDGLLNCSGVSSIEVDRVALTNTRIAPVVEGSLLCSALEYANLRGDYNDRLHLTSANSSVKGYAGGNNGAFNASGLLGGAAGSHFADCFFSATSGGLVIFATAKTASEPSNSACVIISGDPQISSITKMRSIGDRIEWTWPWFILGHTSLQNAAFTFSGTNQSNHLFQYQIDTGSGFGAWKTLNGANLSAEAISPTTGFRLKVAAECIVANSGNAIAGILIPTTTTAIDQQTLYPIGETVPVQIFQCPAGATVAIYRLSDDFELYKGLANGQGEVNIAYIYEGVDIPVRVVVRLSGHVPREEEAPIKRSGLSLPMRLELDLTDNV